MLKKAILLGLHQLSELTFISQVSTHRRFQRITKYFWQFNIHNMVFLNIKSYIYFYDILFLKEWAIRTNLTIPITKKTVDLVIFTTITVHTYVCCTQVCRAFRQYFIFLRTGVIFKWFYWFWYNYIHIGVVNISVLCTLINMSIKALQVEELSGKALFLRAGVIFKWSYWFWYNYKSVSRQFNTALMQSWCSIDSRLG